MRMIKTEFGNALPNSYGHYIISDGKYRGQRLHRLRYEAYHNIKIPDDCDIHHIDEDKSNNDINNLVMMTHTEHTLHHKTLNEWRVIKKGVDENGDQLWALYSPSGKKVRTSTNKNRLMRSMERRKKQEAMKEKPKHDIAFEKYYDMGENRTLKELSEETGIHKQTLSTWKNSFNWEEKIDNRDKGQLQIMQRDRLEANQEARSIYQETIRQIMKEQVIQPLMNGTFDIEVKNISDIKRLIELDNMLAREDKEENRQAELDAKDKEIVNLIESDEDTWEMLTKKLVEKQGDNNG